MKELWNNSNFNDNVIFPKDIVSQYCKQLNEKTNGNVILEFESFEKTINEMTVIAPVFDLPYNKMLTSKKPENKLGVVSESSRFNNELYLTGKKTDTYKYRICFIENGIYPYPTEIVIDEIIAKELNVGTRLTCDNSESFENVLINILSSKKVNEVIEGLYTINVN